MIRLKRIFCSCLVALILVGVTPINAMYAVEADLGSESVDVNESINVEGVAQNPSISQIKKLLMLVGFRDIFSYSSPEKIRAVEYYTANSTVHDCFEVHESDSVQTELDVLSLMDELGFYANTVYYEHLMNGEVVDDTPISESSGQEHPAYLSYYVAENGDYWVIYIINGEVYAYPFSFNLVSTLGVETIVSTTDTITSYDDASNMFFVTTPYDSALIVKKVDAISPDVLDQLTIEKLCEMTGAELPLTTVESDLHQESIETLEYSGTVTYRLPSVKANAPLMVNQNYDDPFIVVSLGDSYSSGEGIEPFYGQNDDLRTKVENEDWLSHRSEKSWPGQIKIPGISGTMADYRVKPGEVGTGPVQWYFAAVSGATTMDIQYNKQTKKYYKEYRNSEGYMVALRGHEPMPIQIDIFDKIDGTIDLVTATIGGNDVDFAGIITDCAIHSTYIYLGDDSKLQKKLDSLWENFEVTERKIKETYRAVARKAPKANIIVAGYPELLCYTSSSKSVVINQTEAAIVNYNVIKFNLKLWYIIDELRDEGLNIHFVDVIDAFDDHEAYSDEPYINPIILGAKSQDIDDRAVSSAYSIHPNELGAKAYATCVNKKIREVCGGTFYDGFVVVDAWTDFDLGEIYMDLWIAGEVEDDVTVTGIEGYDFADLSTTKFSLLLCKDELFWPGTIYATSEVNGVYALSKHIDQTNYKQYGLVDAKMADNNYANIMSIFNDMIESGEPGGFGMAWDEYQGIIEFEDGVSLSNRSSNKLCTNEETVFYFVTYDWAEGMRGVRELDEYDRQVKVFTGDVADGLFFKLDYLTNVWSDAIGEGNVASVVFVIDPVSTNFVS